MKFRDPPADTSGLLGTLAVDEVEIQIDATAGERDSSVGLPSSRRFPLGASAADRADDPERRELLENHSSARSRAVDISPTSSRRAARANSRILRSARSNAGSASVERGATARRRTET